MDHTFLVPVRMIAAGTLALRIGRLGSGERVGLAFTSEASLMRTLGPSQQWVRLAREALDDMLAPLGIEHITIDPDRVGEACPDGPPSQRRPTPEHLQAVAAAA
jgi:hypothetical protein